MTDIDSARAAEPAILVRGLAKRYQDVTAVDGLDLEVRTGETFALLGPNGAGKTTTTEILEGYRPADAGEIRVLGEDPATADRRWRARIGIVMQESRDIYELTVDELLRHFAGYFPAPRPVDEVIELVGLGEKRGSRMTRLSGGQRRRMDVALAIIGRPELLFLDEPTTGFDPSARRQFWELIHQLKAAGTTILLTTHYLEEAERLADRVAVVAKGRVVALGTPAELGGRDRALVRVGWTDPDEGERTETTAAPTKLVVELAARYGGEVPGLRVQPPTLEDIYLELTREGDGA
ncbi:MAG TPA: ABC transporter ATP-binding protein [Actinocrinis sp.]